MPLIGALALALAASATPLVWIAPEGCPASADVRAALEARLAGAPTTAEPALVARAFALPDGAWRLVLSTEGAADPGRVVEGASCREIADAAVVLASLALRRAPPTVAATPVEGGASLRTAATVGLGLGALPEPALVTALEVAYGSGAWAAFAGAAVWWPREGVVEGASVAGASLALVAGRAGACARTEWAGAWLGACGALEVGWLGGRGFGARDNTAGGAPWVALSAGPSVRRTLVGGFGWVAEVQAYAAVVRPRFVLDGVGEVHVPAAVGLRVSAGVELEIP